MNKAMYGVPVVAAILVGCASAPEVQIRYFAPKAVTAITATQTLDCTNDKSRLLISHAPAATTTYSSDRSRSFVLDTAPLRSAWANTEMTVELTDDGRLASVNHTASGQGESIVKAILAFAAAPPVGGGKAKDDPCARLAAFNGGKAAIITYEATIDHSTSPAPYEVTLKPSIGSMATHSAVGGSLPVLTVSTAPPKPVQPVPPAPVSMTDSGGAWVTLVEVAPVEFTFKVDGVPGPWTSGALVPTKQSYRVFIPAPKPFGKQVFVLTLHGSGAIQKLGYNADSGVTAGANAATSLANFKTTADTASAAALKAEAEEMAAAARVANCRAKPLECK